MNRIIKKFVVFVLPFLFLLINVSYATFDMNSQPSATVGFSTDTSLVTPFIEEFTSKTGYTPEEVLNTALYKNSSNETQKQLYITTLNACSSAGYHIVTSDSTVLYIFPNSEGFDVGVYSSYFCQSLPLDYSFMQIATNINRKAVFPCTSAGRRAVTGSYTYHNSKVKSLTSSYTWDESRGYYFEPTLVNPVGTYYAPGTEPDTPSLPSNAEIAKAVQAFYNSDYYKNNKDFSDFIVTYSYATGYFDFIGHNFGIDLGQVIVPPNYEYDGYSYNQDWWKFFLRNITSQVASNLWNRYYWLYSSNDFGENIKYEGKGAINDLINLHFSTSTIIVYSTTDYPVVKIETNEETGILEPVEGTIPGDQYTYNETLDPTTNEYNPLENFVPTNPSQTILGDVDFNEINKTFEENKDILNIENASWLFTANNQLTNYFIGFLSLLIVFLIISRILGG